MAATSDGKQNARGQKLWAVLLVLDSFFVIIFGGAVAAKIYQHWQTPPLPPPRHLPPRKPAPKPPEPAAEPAKPTMAPAAQAAKPAQAPPLRSDMPRPGKPSLLQDGPRPHENAAPQGPQSEAAAVQAAAPTAKSAPAAPGARSKALPVDFHLKAPNAKKVELAGAFIVHGGRKAMVEHDGVWSLTLYLTPNTYRYHFLVDGRRKLDPENSKADRGASVVTVQP